MPNRHPVRIPLVLLAATSAVERDSAVLHALLDLPGLTVIGHDMTEGPGGEVEIRRTVTDATSTLEDVPVHLDHPCLGCLAREDLVPALADLQDRRPFAVLVVLPLGAELFPVVATLAGHLHRELAGYRLAGTVAALDAARLVRDLTDGDEDLLAHLAQADVLALSDGGTGTVPGLARDVTDSLRPAGSEVALDLGGTWLRRALARAADPERLELRADPAGGAVGTRRIVADERPDGTQVLPSGVWRTVLASDRPLHPGRLLAEAEHLSPEQVVTRGPVAVAGRPGLVCGWQGVGGTVRFGAAETPGRPGAAPAPISTRIAAVGVSGSPVAIRAAFGRALLTDAELAAGMDRHVPAPDPLLPYLGA